MSNLIHKFHYVYKNNFNEFVNKEFIFTTNLNLNLISSSTSITPINPINLSDVKIKKICFLFFGGYRTYNKRVNEWKNVFDNLKKNNIEVNVYGHTFLNKNDKITDIFPIEIDDQNRIESYYYNKYKDLLGFHSKNNKNEITKKIGCVFNLHSLKKISAKISYDHDFVVVSRYDMFPLNIDNILIDNIFKEKTIYVPKMMSYDGICDRFAMGDMNVMKIYCDRLNNLYNSHNPEGHLQSYLENKNVNYQKVNVIIEQLF
jgi:hypothetical protein